MRYNNIIEIDKPTKIVETKQMTKISKTKALRSEPRFEEDPFALFHPILVTDDNKKFSGPLFIENIRKYDGGYQNWMRDNRELFEKGGMSKMWNHGL